MSGRFGLFIRDWDCWSSLAHITCQSSQISKLSQWWVSEATESWGASIALVGHGSIVLKKSKTTTEDWISSYFFSSSSDQKCDCSLFGWPLSKPTQIIQFLFLKLNSERRWFFKQLFFVSLDVVIDYGAWKFSYLPCSACWNGRLPKELKQWKKGLTNEQQSIGLSPGQN